MSKKKPTFKEYFQIGHLYEYEMNKFSQVIENGGFITKTFILKGFTKEWSFGTLEPFIVLEDIQSNGETRTFPYRADSMDFLKKIS
jgi:hypothetical protein